MKIRFAKKAAAELKASALWYEEQSKGLGSEFTRSIDAALSRISRTPMLYTIALDDMRRCLLKKFPFGIFFVIESDHIVVVSIFHLRRSPKKLHRTDR